MSRRKQSRRDHGALRDEWIDRQLRGEALSLKAYSDEKQVSYGSLRNRGRSWREELERRSAEISREVAEVTSIDHTAMRVAVLREREPLRKLYMQQVSRWAKHLTDNPTERVPIKDLVALGNLLIRMAEVGAGLPKEHVARHDEVHEEVRVNRRQIEEAKSDIVDFAKWRRERRLKAGKRKTVTKSR